MQNSKNPLYTIKNNCQDCYKCVRQCPVKSIQIVDHSASIMYDTCTYCGRCVLICPSGAKHIREDYSRVQQWLDSGQRVIAMLAPAYVSEYYYAYDHQVIGALKFLGFWEVSEVALGAEEVSHHSLEYVRESPNNIFISTCCPTIVEMIGKYNPELEENMVPVLSPMLASAKMLKRSYPEAKVVFIGPCISKKKEGDDAADLIDAVITFGELNKMFDDNGVDIKSFEANEETCKFFPRISTKGALFPLDGGMVSNMMNLEERHSEVATDEVVANVAVGDNDIEYMSFTGFNICREILKEIPNMRLRKKLFLELMACEGGCLRGPGMTNKSSQALKEHAVIRQEKVDDGIKKIDQLERVEIECNFKHIKPVIECKFSEDDIISALSSIGKISEKDEINCSGCGYDSCRDFAVALLKNVAERGMCVSYMRRVANDKTAVLIDKLPYGFITIDDKMRVVDCNQKFVDTIGGEVKELYEMGGSLVGADIRKLVSFHKMFSDLLDMGGEMVEQDVRDGEAYFHVSVTTVQKYKLVCGVVQDMREPGVRKEIVVDRVKEVITKNMEVVQKIAYLLGENASFNESMLNSILDSHDEK